MSRIFPKTQDDLRFSHAQCQLDEHFPVVKATAAEQIVRHTRIEKRAVKTKDFVCRLGVAQPRSIKLGLRRFVNIGKQSAWKIAHLPVPVL